MGADNSEACTGIDAALTWDAVILAGGRATRLGGIRKPLLSDGGSSLFERAVKASAGAARISVVGPGHLVQARRGDGPDERRLQFVLEEPRFGGPVAALAAALRSESAAPWTLVLAADLPRVESAVPRLLDGVSSAERQAGDFASVDGIVAVDERGHPQPLLAYYRTQALRSALAALDSVHGASMRSLLAGIELRLVPLSEGLADDVDTPEDATRHGLAPGSAAMVEVPRVA